MAARFRLVKYHNLTRKKITYSHDHDHGHDDDDDDDDDADDDISLLLPHKSPKCLQIYQHHGASGIYHVMSTPENPTRSWNHPN